MPHQGPASELWAVNELLAAVGEDPVESLEHLPPSGNTALFILRTMSRDLQEEGHWFNRDTDYELTPDPADDHILIPANIISLDGSDSGTVERHPHLYDAERQSFEFDGPVTVAVILHLDWEKLPSVARRYITALATERFVDGFPGADAVTEARHRNLLRAKVAFERAAIRNERLNLLDNQTIMSLTRRS